MNEETIKLQELEAALQDVDLHVGAYQSCIGSVYVGKATWPEELAADLFEHAKKHREPEYVDGAAYVDAYGEVWQYNDSKHGWNMFGLSVVARFETPKRPLTRLVPEDSNLIETEPRVTPRGRSVGTHEPDDPDDRLREY